MYKLVLLSIFVALAAARIGQVRHWPFPIHAGYGNSTTKLGQVIEGFNDYFHIENDTDIDNCADIPLIRDLNKTFTDLNASKPNPIALVSDVIALYNDYHKIKNTCPQVAASLETFFGNFTTACRQEPKKTAEKVGLNIAGHAVEFRALIKQFLEDYNSAKYYQTGQDIGNITSIMLAGYIPQ